MVTSIEFFRSHSPFTDPGDYKYLYLDLPDEIPQLVEMIQGQLMHRKVAASLGGTLTRESRREIHLRTIQERLEKIISLDSSPLTVQRNPEDRQIGLCRDFALFLTSFLRHKGIPARMRVGFAEYLQPGSIYKIDHWITEYWQTSSNNWILIDPDAMKFNIQSDKDFYFAGSAWKIAREGKMRPDIFRYSGRWKGFPCIRGNLLHDFQSLNKLELGLFDYWDELHTKPESSLSIEDKRTLDQIADLTLMIDENLKTIQDFFDSMPRTKRIFSKLSMLGVINKHEVVQPEDITGSEMDRLVAMQALDKRHEILNPRLENRFNNASDDDLPKDHPAYTQPQYTFSGIGDIVVKGARQHNLKGIDVVIPRHKFVVITGVSGSGKSSLAFDTIYAEGQRRYVESLSSFARQFMDQMEKPLVDQITGLSPAIAIEQKTISRNPRSTVGTVTEILDYLRVLYARIGTPHCPQCGQAVIPQSANQIGNQLSKLPPGTRFQLLAPLARNQKGTFKKELQQSVKAGYTRARIDGELFDLLNQIPKIDKNRKHNIELVIDRLTIPKQAADFIQEGGEQKPDSSKDFQTRLIDSIETSLRAGKGTILVTLDNDEIILSEHNACSRCNISFPTLEPHLFSFNSPLGMCPECNGLGVKLQVDPDLIIEKPELSIMDGACRWYGNLRKNNSKWRARNLKSIAEHYNTNLEIPWKDLPRDFRNTLLYGSGGVKFKFQHASENEQGGTWSYESHRDIQGIIFHINRLFRQTKSEYTRRHYMSFMSQLPCPLCKGERLNPEARFVTIDGKRLPELTSWSIEAIHKWIADLPNHLNLTRLEIGGELIKEIHERIGFLRNVGLHYLSLDRPAPTLSGGEGQRIRLASQIGSGLVGVMYILDEPSIGLHARDHRSLLDTLIHLRNLGNTVLIVEHDEVTMRSADWIIDLGPGPGVLGGRLVADGPLDAIISNPESITGKYLSGELKVIAPNGKTRRSPKDWLTIKSARLHNLKSINARFPLGTMIAVTGVSGSGKSSLIGQTLYPALARILNNASIATPGPYNGFDGLDRVDKVINITQDPIGRNPRSNPGTYVGVLPEIRKVFAEIPQSKALGYKPGRFSFNVKGGRCEECKGYGSKKVKMHFLPDVWVKCRVCEGSRFNRQTLEIRYKNKNIAEVLDMDVQETLAFFANHPRIVRKLETMHDVGLDYIKIGQSALTLSGGEAQRVKLSKELSKISTGKTIYILDEPTTGLHFADIQRLIDVLHKLVDAGNTVIVIEHNLDVICSADWIIDLGPEGGDQGGYIVSEGTPEQVASTGKGHTSFYLYQFLNDNDYGS